MPVPERFCPWVHFFDPDYAVLHNELLNELDEFRVPLYDGLPIADAFPDDVVLKLEPGSGVQLTDSLPNTSNIYVISERLKDVIAKSGQPAEFLPVRIRNHKKRVAPEPYYIMNLLGSLDCMDRQKSEWRESELDPGQADRIYRLVLDEGKIPPDCQLFRLGTDHPLVIVRLPFAQAIYRQHECRGMIFQKIETYGEQFRKPVISH